MSIIIRLQNLPLSAKSGDIRKFFGGLCIPDGGVHILGGEKGDVFIAFMSDEDGRIAMRKDGGRIKDARVKLYLSSRMEMQHEVEKITKNNIADPSFHEDSSRPPDKRWRSRSPHQYKDWGIEHVKPEDYQRSLSPNTRELSPIIYRLHSPQRKSRSPKKSFPSPKLSSFKSKSFMSKKKSVSPKVHNYAHSMPMVNALPQSTWENSEAESYYQNQRQAELEKRITEELEKGDALRMALNQQENAPFGFKDSHQQNVPLRMESSDLFYSQSADNSGSNIYHFQEFKDSYDIKQERLPTDVPSWSHKQIINDSFYVTLSGMDNNWGFREVQLILKGHFAPHINIRWEKDDAGYKTGTAFVKLNKDDFEKVIQKGFFYFNKRRITVSECPNFIVQDYFQLNSHFENENFFPQNQDLCYTLKGLPFSCRYEDIINFFHGCEVANVIIFQGEDGRATGTGFVSFTNWKDFENAFSQNGKKIGHRYIEMLRSSDKEMAEAKRSLPGNFVPYSQILSENNLSASRRPLCALLTGLPVNVTKKKMLLFFSESDLKPDAIHLTLNNKRLSDGRGFVEFFNFLDFDLALKFHGKRFDNNIVCVKQILYDEMVKILDSQKAKHYFANPVPAASASTEPEKVPYLWEPPDTEQEKEIYNKDSRSNLTSDKLSGANYSASPYSITHGKRFSPNDPFRRGPEFFYDKTVPNTSHLYQNKTALENFDMQMPNIDNIQNHNNKYFMNAPGYMFGSTKKYEENIRSSRLSPENEAALLDFLNRDRKPSPDRNNRPRSLERRKRNLFPEKEFGDLKRYKDEQFGKFRSRDNLRIKNEKEGRHSDEKHNFSDEIPVEINPSHFRSDKNEKEKCVVQLSNVDVAIGTRDLISFLRGFDFDEDTLIRRYTSEGEPTPDVRVTFNSIQEAKKAIKILNKQFLHDKKVLMFIAQ